MSSIGGNKQESFSGTKSYGFKLGGRDVEANFKNGAIEKIDRVSSSMFSFLIMF